MVRLVDKDGSPMALRLAVRIAGEPVVELRAHSPLWWDFGVVTVLHTPDRRLCGVQYPSVAQALGTLFQRYFPKPLPPNVAPVDVLEAYVCPHTVGAIKKELLGTHYFSHPYAGGWATQRHSPHLAAVSVSSHPHATFGGYEWVRAQLLRPFVPHDMTDDEAANKVEGLMREVKQPRVVLPSLACAS